MRHRVSLTGSKIHRFWKCPPSIILPQIDDDEPHPAAGRGREIHAFLENVKLVGRVEALARAPSDLRVYLELLNLDELPTHLSTEVAFAYDWKLRTAREIGQSIGRDYHGHLRRTGQAPLRDTEIPLTIDLAGGATLVGGHRRGYVGDWKSGRTKYPAPDRFGQTLLAGLCMRHVYQCVDVVLELVYLRSDGDHYVARRTVDEWDLDTFADELAAAHALADDAEREYIAGRGVTVREGPHCDYCPAFNHCPAKTALVRSIPAELAALGATAAVLRGEEAPAVGTVIAGGVLSRERAADMWIATERIYEVLGRVRDEICGLAAYEEIELPDGRVIGRLVTRRESLDGKIAASVIEEWFGPEARAKAVDERVSKEALREVVVEHVNAKKAAGEKLVIQSKKGDGVLDRALGEIERRGGVEVTVTDSIKPHVPRKNRALNPG